MEKVSVLNSDKQRNFQKGDEQELVKVNLENQN